MCSDKTDRVELFQDMRVKIDHAKQLQKDTAGCADFFVDKCGSPQAPTSHEEAIDAFIQCCSGGGHAEDTCASTAAELFRGHSNVNELQCEELQGLYNVHVLWLKGQPEELRRKIGGGEMLDSSLAWKSFWWHRRRRRYTQTPASTPAPTPAPTPNRPRYIVMPENTNSCDSPYEKVMTAQLCGDAYATLKAEFGSSGRSGIDRFDPLWSSKFDPSGCFQQVTGWSHPSMVLFNHHPANGKDNYRKQICVDKTIPALMCSDTCVRPHSGSCDDDGPDSDKTGCTLGSDCADCGPRDAWCTVTDGSGPSAFYPCSCGKAVCNNQQACNSDAGRPSNLVEGATGGLGTCSDL